MMVAIHTDDLFHPLGSSGATGYALWYIPSFLCTQEQMTLVQVNERRASTNLSLSLCCLR